MEKPMDEEKIQNLIPRFGRTDLPDMVFDHIVAIELDHIRHEYTLVYSEVFTKDISEWQKATKYKDPITVDGNLHVVIKVPRKSEMVSHLIFNITEHLLKPAYPLKGPDDEST
jgi:hypothetical protein